MATEKNSNQDGWGDARKESVQRVQEALRRQTPDAEARLWEALLLFQSYPFHTSRGLAFTYTIRGNEIFFSRKEKSITRATVDRALEKALELGRVVTGPKKLGCFGASYLYPVFQELAVIRTPDTGCRD